MSRPLIALIVWTGIATLLACGTHASSEAEGSASSAESSCIEERGVQICGKFLGAWRTWRGPLPRVGEPISTAFDLDGDRYQVFERVVMNESPAAPCSDRDACVALTGISDAEEYFGRTYDGSADVSCTDPRLAPRDTACLRAAGGDNDESDAMRSEVGGNLAYYGRVISAVQPRCDWWNNGEGPQHFDCFWTERAKVGRTRDGAWEYEALGWKRLRQGKIPGASSAAAAPAAARAPKVYGPNLRWAAFIPAPCEGVEFFGMYNTNNRSFSYDRALLESKVALDVDVGADEATSRVQKHVGESIRYRDDGNWAQIAGMPPWCRKAPPSPVVEYRAQENDAGETVQIGALSNGVQHVTMNMLARNAASPAPAEATPAIEARCDLDVRYEYLSGAYRAREVAFDCKHKKMPSYELYVGGVAAFTHSVTDTNGGPQDLAAPPGIHKIGSCGATASGWACSCRHPKDPTVSVRCDADLTD